MSATVYRDLVLETSTTTGTGTYTLAGAVTGFRTFGALGDGAFCYYRAYAVDGSGNANGSWEIGFGKYAVSGTTLTRARVLASTNSNAAVSWPTGTIRIALVAPAEAMASLTTSHARVGGLNVPLSGAGSIVPANYSRTRAALAKVSAGTGFMKILRIGDSTEAGYGSLSYQSYANARGASPTVFFAAALNSALYPAVTSSVIGSQNVENNGTTVPAYDPRVAYGSGWAGSAVSTVGGNAFSGPSAATGALTFTPFEPCDTFDVYYAINTSGILSPFNVSRSGDTTSATITPNGASQAVGKFTFNGALGINALSIQGTGGSGAGVYIIGVDAYNSALPSIRCLNAGASGRTVAQIADSTNGFGPQPGAVAIAADLAIVSVGINDWKAATTVSTFQSTLDSYVATLLAVSDVILVTAFPSAQSDTALATQKPYVDAMLTIAANRGLVVNDYWRKVGTQEAYAGMQLYSDNLHPNKSLYQMRAEADARLVLSLA